MLPVPFSVPSNWYWSFTYVVLEFHLCGTGVLLMWYWQRTYMHKAGIPIDVFLVFKIQTLYSMINYYFPHI